MSKTSTSREQEIDKYAPRRWIYRNLTPWRIHASYTAEHRLLPRDVAQSRPQNGVPASLPVAKVLSIPALGEIVVSKDDADRLNTLNMRRLGQIELRPAPSELLSQLPRVIMIYGWLATALFFGAWALFFGGGSALPWSWVVAAFVAVPVIALLAATIREIVGYRRFHHYCKAKEGDGPTSSGGERDQPPAFLALHEVDVRAGGFEGRSVELRMVRPETEDRSATAGSRSLEGVERGSRIREFVDGVPRHASEVAVLLGAVLVSVVGLGVAIHLTSQLQQLLPIDYGAIFQLDNPFGALTQPAADSAAFWQLLVGHVAQWVLVSVAALVPAAMYFQFDRQRLASVQRRWVQEVFRLDPTVRTVPDIKAKYGSQIESSFGELAPDSGLRLGSGRRSPVIVATILLVVGWFLIISTTTIPPLDPVLGPAGEVQGYVWSTPGHAFPVPSFFHPNLTPVGYAFLGAYVFTLYHVIRGYQRRDLHPKTYNTIVVRILSAYALALVMSVVYDGRGMEVAMFFVGFTPQSALVWMREKVVQGGKWRIVPIREPAPLTDLEGIDLYDRTRLAEEGINNIEALAHADIVELMSSTRIAAAQLVDWADQAILYLRVGGDAAAREEDDLVVAAKRTRKSSKAARKTAKIVARAKGKNRRQVKAAAATASTDQEPQVPTPAIPAVRENLCHLRSFGIRTASDLMRAYEEALRRGDNQAKLEARSRRRRRSHPQERAMWQKAELDGLRATLALPAPEPARAETIQTVIDTLANDQWFAQIRNWRRPEFDAADAWYLYLDGHDWELTLAAELPRRVRDARRPFETVPLTAVPEPPAAAGTKEAA